MTILGDSINIINNGAADGGNLGSFATAPTANSIGDTYFNSTDNGVYQWDGASWVLQYTVAGGGADASNLGGFATAPTANKIGDTYYNTTTNGYYRWDGTSWVLLFTLPASNPITVGTSPACNTLVISAHTAINTAGVAVNIPASTFTIPAGLSGTVYVMYDVATSTVIANITGFLTDGTVIPLGVATVPTAGGCITGFTAFIDMPEAYQAGGGGGSFTVVGDAPGTGTVSGGGTIDFQSTDGTIFSTISQSGSTTIVNLSAAQRTPNSKCYNPCGLLTLTFPAWNGLPAKTITSTSPSSGVVEIYDGATLLATKTADCNTNCETVAYTPVMQTSYAWLYPYI